LNFEFSHFELFRVGDLLQTLNSVLVADYLDGVGLRLAAGNQLELCLVAEVLEFLAGRPADIHSLDVAGVEVVSGLGGVAGKFAMEFAEVAQAHLVACEQEFLETRHGIGQDASDGTFGEWAVVLCDVVAELVERELLVHLGHAIGFGAASLCADVGFLGAGLCAHDGNGVVNHFFCFWGVKGVNGVIAHFVRWGVKDNSFGALVVSSLTPFHSFIFFNSS